MVPGEPSALPEAWPPEQTLPSPPEEALGPLSPCQGAPGAQGSPPRLRHQPSSAICLLLDSERSLQDMLEHECPPKNEQVLRVSSESRGQRPGLGVLSTACPSPTPSLPGLRAWDPLGQGRPPSLHICSAGRCLWQRASPFPQQPRSGYRGGSPTEEQEG